MKRIFVLVTLLFFVVLTSFSQNILDEVRKHNLERIESRAIRRTRSLLKIPKSQPLFVFSYYAVGLSEYFFSETGTFDDSYKYLKYFKLHNKEIGTASDFLKNLQLREYRCFVYDDSLNIVAMCMGNQVFRYSNTTPDSMYIKYINELQPEFVFEYLFATQRFPIFFYYKNGEIVIVYSKDGKSIISYPLTDWSWLPQREIE